MYKDEIITEVWHNRDEYSKKHHYNLDEIVADLLIREQTHPDRVIQMTPNRQLHNGLPVNVAIPTATTKRTFQASDTGSDLVVCENADDMFRKLGI